MIILKESKNQIAVEFSDTELGFALKTFGDALSIRGSYSAQLNIVPESKNSMIAFLVSHDLQSFSINIKNLWEQLEDIPVNNNGEIDEDFIIEEGKNHILFIAGTDCETIWHWLEDYFDVSIGKEFFS